MLINLFTTIVILAAIFLIINTEELLSDDLSLKKIIRLNIFVVKKKLIKLCIQRGSVINITKFIGRKG